jgi:hypothetical protein
MTQSRTAGAATLIKPLALVGIPVTELSTSDLVVAHGNFIDTLNAGRLRFVPHPALDTAARLGVQCPLGGASTWDRGMATVDIGPLLSTATTSSSPCSSRW